MVEILIPGIKSRKNRPKLGYAATKKYTSIGGAIDKRKDIQIRTKECEWLKS